jgi:uncharacterized membrane protein YfcA
MLASLPWAEIALVSAIFILGGFVKGVVGFGLPTITLGLLALTRPLPEAMALAVGPTLATNIWQGLAGGALRSTLRRLRWFLAAAGLGTLGAAGVLARADARLLSGLLGLLVIASALLALFGPRWPVPSLGTERWLSPLMGLLSGIANGLTGSFLMPAAPWLGALRLPPDQFVQAFGLSASLVTALLALSLAGQGMIPPGLGLAGVAVLAPAFLGLWLGRRTRSALPERQFRLVVQGLLLALGLHLAIRGLS